MVNYTPELLKVPSKVDVFAEMEVTDIMLGDFISLHKDTSILEASKILLKDGLNAVPVVDENNRLLGILSERECLRYNFDMQYYNECPLTVYHHMTTEVLSLHEHDKLFHAIKIILDHHYHMYPVLDDESKVLGVVTIEQILRKTCDLNQTTW